MRRLFFVLPITLIVLSRALIAEREVFARLQANNSDAYIEYPAAGQAVQGIVEIRGSTGMGEIQSYEVDFGFAIDPSQTWFLIQEGTLSIANDVLARWDTTKVTDGEYVLRLMVRTANDTTQVVMVNGIRIRNYSPIETNTPSPTARQATDNPRIVLSLPSGFISTPTFVSIPRTPLQLSSNPAEITTSQVVSTLGKGVVITLVSFALLGAYLGLRIRTKKRE